MKNADLQTSYAAPVRVSGIMTCCLFVVARDDMPEFDVVRRGVSLPVARVATERELSLRVGVKTVVRAFVVRSATFVDILFCWVARCNVLPSRTAAPACAKDIAIAITKIRIFFISGKIVSKIAISGQVKYSVFI